MLRKSVRLLKNLRSTSVYSIQREIRGLAPKQHDHISESTYGSISMDSGRKKINYGVENEIDTGKRISSLYGHRRMPLREEGENSVQRERQENESMIDQQMTVARRHGFDMIEPDQEENEESAVSSVPTGDTELGQFNPLPQPVPAAPRKPRSFLQTYTLTPLVNDSELLRNLVDLGVNLSKFDNLHNVADWLIKLDWTNDVKPLLRFLHETCQIPLEKIGEYVTGNPWVLQQSLDDLQIRIRYLESKKFSSEAISRIVIKAKYWLNFHVKTIDKRLGYLQQTFQLSGDEVRFVVTHSPKLVTIGTGYMQLIMFTFKHEMGFNDEELRQLLVKDPRLYLTPKPVLQKSFDYLHNEMKFSHKTLISWPSVLRAPRHYVQRRHEYLKSIGRDQYDPEKPNFVPLHTFGTMTDFEFATKIAKTSVSQYNKFMKKF